MELTNEEVDVFEKLLKYDKQLTEHFLATQGLEYPVNKDETKRLKQDIERDERLLNKIKHWREESNTNI